MLFKVDVPVVVTSGNNGRKPGRVEVDSYPALLAGDDMPLIVVGSIDPDGKKSAFSQGGPKVAIHAVGKQSTCLPKSGKDPIVRDGTSVGKPLLQPSNSKLFEYLLTVSLASCSIGCWRNSQSAFLRDCTV